MRFKKKFFSIAILICIDLCAFLTSFILSFYSRKLVNLLPFDLIRFEATYGYFIKLWWIPIIFILFIAYENLYTKRYPFWDEARELVKAVTISVVVVFAIVSLGKKTEDISRLTILFLWGYSLFLFPMFRFIGKRMLYRYDVWKNNLLILGAGKAGTTTAQGLIQDKHLGYKVVGFLDDFKRGSVEIEGVSIPILGSLGDFKKVVKEKDVETVVIAIPSMGREKISELTNEVHKYVNRIFIVPDLKGIALLNSELYHLFVQQLFLIKIKNNLDSRLNQLMKRGFDIIISLLILPFILPLICIIGLAIKLDSPGGIFFLNRRLGKDGKIFNCYKFRTMYENNDEILREYLKKNPYARREWEKYKKLKGYDPRVTRVGRFLRKFSLDELPQIFNVLRGEMSLVGPRPYLPREEKDMGEYKETILMTRPGITGLWQISGRNELTFDHRLQLDTWYVLNWSLWLDIVILLKTIVVVLKREGAY